LKSIATRVEHASVEEWWEPFTLGVGPAGAYVAKLAPAQKADLRERCRRILGAGQLTIPARAWAARGMV
jgi:hypothetical protein